MTQRWSTEDLKAAKARVFKPKAKYGNEKVKVDGFTFDSKREAAHYQNLLLRQKAGEIRYLELQVPYAIVINNQYICDYIADFSFDQKVLRGATKWEWVNVVADAKGHRTAVYQIKKKLMRAALGISILEL